MELLSNDMSKIWQRAREELSERCSNTWVFYTEIPHFHNEFSIFVEEDESNHFKMVTRFWDKIYDLKKYQQLGILNLDRLRIVEKTLFFSEKQNERFLELLKILQSKGLPERMEDEDILVLDGCEYKLYFSNPLIQKEYRWRIANRNYAVIEGIVSFLLENNSLQEFEKPE